MKHLKTFERYTESSSFVKPLLDKLKPQLVEQDLGNLEIEEILNDAFEKHNVTFEYNPQSEYGRDDFASVGICEGYVNEDGGIFIVYGQEFYQTFDDPMLYNSFVHVVNIIVSHELVHIHQINMMKNNDIDYIKPVDMTSNGSYMSDRREIMAFAKEAVEDYIGIGYDKAGIVKMLKNEKGIGIPIPQESEAFYRYNDMFSDEPKIFNLFKKYMIQFLDAL